MYTRKATNKIIEMAEEGLISWSSLAMMALKWLSEDNVEMMLRANDVLIDDDGDECNLY